MDLIFLKPQYGWLFLIFVLIWLLCRYLRKTNYIATTTLNILDPILLTASVVRKIPGLLLLLAIIMLGLSIMDPVIPMAERQVESQGLDIIIVLDLSESMQEVMDRENQPELEPAPENEMMSMEPRGRTRLRATREAIRDFIVGRRDDRIGMIVFADNAYLVSPLTLDHDFLLHYVDMVDENILGNEKKTAIGDGIALANSMLQRQRGNELRGEVIVVYTDGEHNHGRDPIEVLSQVNLNGIKLHLLGVDLEQRIREKETVQQLIEAVLAYGGSYFDAETEADLLRASTEIDTMEKGRVVSREYVQQVPVYHWFAVPAAIFIVLAFGLRVFPYFSTYT